MTHRFPSGQEIVIRKNSNAAVQTNNPPASVSGVSQSARKGTHTVAASQTLYSIARDYGVTVEQLRAWNKLTGNELSVGQVLFVTQPAYSTTTPVTTSTQPATSKETNVSTPVQQTQSQQQPVQGAPTAQSNPSPITITESVKGSDEVMESGLAELIEGTEGNRKYLALHRTAPVGTILKIRNEMNNREVFVRVMGKLPDTALTNSLIIKISKSAYDRLGAIDQRFRVQITYYK
ncbi:MAG: LysM peptidoglycan-binding domain-containing protein [Bacteroidia bacterium]|nr:LysM peptidoglycan-binding domain-containing protein [Bacteroidia bacterium]